jgi:hypothetical protein
MKLDAMQESILLRAARLVDDDFRDEFFALVAAKLSHLGDEIFPSDVRHACGSAIVVIRENDDARKSKRRAG